MASAGIRLEGVTKRFGDAAAVDDVSLTVEAGELLVLVGPSGCGKTTLLRLIAGLEEPTAGEIYLDGESVTGVPARKRDVALVFQDFALFPHMDVRDNISFNLRMQGYDDIDERVEEVADLLGVRELLDRDVDALSGGQQQRVALGRAIVSEPRAFLLDEPLANLDERLRERMQTEIARLQERIGITTVHVTHNQAEAMTMGDRIAVLDDGELQQVGRPEEVYARPANRFVAEFVGHPPMNLLSGSYRPEEEAVVADDGDTRIVTIPVTLETRGAVHVGIRPEAIEVMADPPSEPSPDRLRATVTYDEFRGANRYLYLERDGVPELIAQVDSHTEIDEGDEVELAFPTSALHFFSGDSGERVPVGR